MFASASEVRTYPVRAVRPAFLPAVCGARRAHLNQLSAALPQKLERRIVARHAALELRNGASSSCRTVLTLIVADLFSRSSRIREGFVIFSSVYAKCFQELTCGLRIA